MTACIVGWSHTPFGKHEAEDVESLIVKAARAAVADAGLGPDDIDEIVRVIVERSQHRQHLAETSRADDLIRG